MTHRHFIIIYINIIVTVIVIVVIIIELAAARLQFTMEVTPMIVVFVASGLLEGRGRGRMVLAGPSFLTSTQMISAGWGVASPH